MSAFYALAKANTRNVENEAMSCNDTKCNESNES